jgi:hypothetical protein
MGWLHSKPIRTIEVTAALLAVGTFGYGLYATMARSRTLARPSVCVFLPNPNIDTGGAFYQDGTVQKKGFDQACNDADNIPGKLDVGFEQMTQEERADQLLEAMKRQYKEKGTTFFVMTMSSKIEAIRRVFAKWRKECAQDGKPPPVLIATVASAPDLADARNGILRWYIRSDEESALLAEFMRWKLGVTDATVFYVTRTAGQSDDTYGKRGMEVFRSRFYALGGRNVQPLPITAKNAKEGVAAFKRTAAATNPAQVGVLLVGYGEMVPSTIEQLQVQGYSGPILCTSTLTEPTWQPRNQEADSRIFTVLPRLADANNRLRAEDRNVVYLFAKETLYRVLELTAADPNCHTFIDRWQSLICHTQPATTLEKIRPQFDQECLADGDTIVQLDVVGADEWR